jgi:hypothetical protein
MAEPGGKMKRRAKRAALAAVDGFVKGLSEEHRMLVILKRQLYGGAWEPMLGDLRSRLEGRPYIFKLANRIEEDVARIEQMQQFEEEHGVDLADYVEMA